jgi:hypothetical protein
MSIAEKLSTIAENEQKVYDAGYDKAEQDKDLETWKILTGNGTRLRYERAFYGCSFPKDYSFVKPVTPKYCERMFYDMKGQFPKNVDFSNVTALSGSNESNMTFAIFAWSVNATYLCDMKLQAPMAYVSTWAYCKAVKTIEKIRVKKETQFLGGAIGLPFLKCDALENVTFEGVIGQNLSLSSSSALSYASLKNIISCLYDFVGNGETVTRTLTLHATAKARLTEDDVKAITDKGWTLV